MAERVIKETHTRRVRDADDEVVDARRSDGQVLLARLVYFIAGAIITLLAFRFILAMLGANRGNPFAEFVFDASNVFVSPFFGLFSYDDYVYGVARIEIYALFAMLVYAVIAYGIVYLITLNRNDVAP